MSHNGSDKPPPVGVLFKGAPRGKIWQELTTDTRIPEWMHVTTQCKGSYRADNMWSSLNRPSRLQHMTVNHKYIST